MNENLKKALTLKTPEDIAAYVAAAGTLVFGVAKGIEALASARSKNAYAKQVKASTRKMKK